MIKITAGLAENLIEWLEIDAENAYDEDDRERAEQMIDELQKAMEEEDG